MGLGEPIRAWVELTNALLLSRSPGNGNHHWEALHDAHDAVLLVHLRDLLVPMQAIDDADHDALLYLDRWLSVPHHRVPWVGK